jgi:hypothetical protein
MIAFNRIGAGPLGGHSLDLAAQATILSALRAFPAGNNLLSAICHLPSAISFEPQARITLAFRRESETGDLSAESIPGSNCVMGGNNLSARRAVDGVKSGIWCVGIIPDLKCPSEKSLHSKRGERP